MKTNKDIFQNFKIDGNSVSIEEIARLSGISVEEAIESTMDLVEKGFLTIIKINRKNETVVKVNLCPNPIKSMYT